MKKKISFLVDNIEYSELLFDISLFVSRHIDDHDILIFFKNNGKPYVYPQCPMMNICDLYGYTGSVVATSIDTARILISAVGPQQKIFYPYDLWTSLPSFSYGSLASVIKHPSLEKFCRSENHQNLIDNNFDEAYNTVENFDGLLPFIKEGNDYLEDILEINQFYERQEILR